MHRRLGAELAAEHLVGAVGDHLVDVHVGLGAGAGLPDHQREMIVELAVDHLLARPGRSRACASCVEIAERVIDLGGGALDDAERADQRQRHALGADAEILPRALGLGAPVAVGRHLDRAEACRSRCGSACGCRCGLWPSNAVPCCPWSTVDAGYFFLRKRSSRTTSAPPLVVRLLSPAALGACRGRDWPARAAACAARRTRRAAWRASSLGVSVLATASSSSRRRPRTAARTAPTDRRSP